MELCVKNVSKYFGSSKALDDISFSVSSGEIIGLLGHNGAGKSTLIKCIMGAIKSYSGNITIDGVNIKKDRKVLSNNCSFLYEPSFCEYIDASKNLNYLKMITENQSLKTIDEILSIVSLRKTKNKKVGEFSFGMKQRLGLAQVLLSDSKFVILDEPTIGLDPIGIEIIKNLIIGLSKTGVSVIFSSHQINDIFDICTRAIIINDGKIVFDDLSNKLMNKNYMIKYDNKIKNLIELKTIYPDVEINENVILLKNGNQLSTIINFMNNSGLNIIDINTQNNFESLMKFMYKENQTHD